MSFGARKTRLNNSRKVISEQVFFGTTAISSTEMDIT